MFIKISAVYFSLIAILTLTTANPIRQSVDEDNEYNNLSNEDFSDEYDTEQRIQFEKYFENILKVYFDNYVKPGLVEKDETKTSKYSKYFDELEQNEEMVPNDMPAAEESESMKTILSSANSVDLSDLIVNQSNTDVTTLLEDRQKEREKTKSERINQIRSRVLLETGRNNTFISPDVATKFNKLKEAFFQNGITNGTGTAHPLFGNTGKIGDYTEKIRSFYPSCEIPRNTDEEMWKDMNTMNLYFNVDYKNGISGGITGQAAEDETVNIESSVLRLYRLPQTNSTDGLNYQKTDSPQYISDEDKQIRVSVYWYIRSLKKQKAVRKRLTDSKMVPLTDRSGGPQYLEFNIRPATKSWVKGRNLGLAIVVQDMDDVILSAEKYFKGVGCDTVGNVSTPKPLPTLVDDALRIANGIGETSNGSSANTYAYHTFLPKLDVHEVYLPFTNIFSVLSRKLNASNTDKNFNETLKHIAGAQSATETPHRIRHHHTWYPPNFNSKIQNQQVVMNSTDVHKFLEEYRSNINR